MKVAFQTWEHLLPFTLEEVDESGTTVGDLRVMYNDIAQHQSFLWGRS